MNGQSTNALVGPLDSDVAIKSRILTIRGAQVMLDRDLAELYGVSTKALNQAVKRNMGRFPSNFMFELLASEMFELVTNCDRFPLQKVFFDGRHYCAVSKMDAAFIPSIMQRM